MCEAPTILEEKMSSIRHVRVVVLIAALTLIFAACSSDDDSSDGGSDAASSESEVPVANACPADGCVVEIADVAAEGEELAVTFDANFLPDISKNHIHIYWDTFTADQVSSDAETRNVAQGDWHPTGDYPDHVTESGASVANRGDSTTLCVTAANRDHEVIDSAIVHCRDVSDLL